MFSTSSIILEPLNCAKKNTLDIYTLEKFPNCNTDSDITDSYNIKKHFFSSHLKIVLIASLYWRM